MPPKKRASGRRNCPGSHPRRKQEDLVFAEDEFIRAGQPAEVLAKLRPAFRKEGRLSHCRQQQWLNDGACALLMCQRCRHSNVGLSAPWPGGRASAVVGVEPRIMGIGPVEAIQESPAARRTSAGANGPHRTQRSLSPPSLGLHPLSGLQDDDPADQPTGRCHCHRTSLGHDRGAGCC